MVEATRADAAVLARMGEAVRFLRAAGLDVDSADDRDAHLRRAVRWQRYSRGAVSAEHRTCAIDVVRGSLRLWSLSGGVPAPLNPTRAPTRPMARVQCSALVRTSFAALRADLGAEAAGLSRRGVGAFEDRVRRELLRVWLEVDAALAGLGLTSDPTYRPPLEQLLAPRRRPRLENRLTTVLGAGFGAGVSLTVGRLVAVLWPSLAAGLACGLLGLALTTWTVLARRLLTERNVAERWMLEAVTNVRTALEEQLLTRMLAAEQAAD